MVKKISGGLGGTHPEGDVEENTQSIRKPKKDMTVEERNLIRAQKYDRKTAFLDCPVKNIPSIPVHISTFLKFIFALFNLGYNKSNRNSSSTPVSVKQLGL